MRPAIQSYADRVRQANYEGEPMTITKAEIATLREDLANAKFYAWPDNLFNAHDADLYRAMLTALPALIDAAEERDALREKLADAEKRLRQYTDLIEQFISLNATRANP